MKKKNIIIIGSGGFIGESFCEKLNKFKNLEIVKISRKNFGDNYTNLNWFKKIKKNSIIYFLAFENDLNFFEKNYVKLTNKYESFCKKFFSFLKKKKLNPKIIFTSTVTVYGMTNNKQVNENFKTTPISWYDFTKLTIERYFEFLSSIYNVDFVCLRLSNVYGYSKNSQYNRGFINNIIRKSIKKKKISVKIFDDGIYYRDYIYIEDVNSALLYFLNKKKLKDKIFNLCYGKSLSILNLLNKIKSKLKKKNITLKIIKSKSPDNINLINKRNFFGSNLKLKKNTIWKPKYDIDKGIDKTINKYFVK